MRTDAISGGATAVLCATTGPLLLAVLTSLAGGVIGAWQFPIGVLVGLAASYLASPSLRRNPRLFALVATSTLVGVIAFVRAATALYDLSYDGQAYHQSSILALLGGWNPAHDHATDAHERLRLLSTHYPNGAWLFGAAVARTVGLIEGGKALGWLLATGAFLATWAALEEHERPARAWRPFVALLAAATPVTLTQLPTFYVDGALSSALLVGTAGAFLARRREGLVLLGLSVVWLLSLKFSGAVYSVLLVGTAAVAWRAAGDRARARTVAMTGAVSLGVATCVIGFSPYLTNTIHHRQPFYPIVGSSFSPVSDQVPPVFLARSSFARLALSLASPTEVIAPPESNGSDVKWPFSVSRGELQAAAYPDARRGGFGPLFSGALLLAMLIVTLDLLRQPSAKRARRRSAIAFLAAGILVSVLVNPHAFWARYAPQLYWLPILVACLGERRRHGAHEALRRLLLTTILVNSAIFVIAVTHEHLLGQAALRHELAAMPRDVRLVVDDMPSTRRRLEEAGIATTTVTSCPSSRAIFGSTTRLCSDGD